MNLLDMRTVVFSNVITDIVCTLFIVLLWRQSRNRFAGTSLWVYDFAFQTIALILIILRGSIADWASMVLSNTLVIAGALLGYMALERFVGKTSSQIHNYVLLAVFIFVHSYFTLVQPDLAVRNLNLAAALLIICFQCAWLVFYRVQPGTRRMTLGVGMVFSAYCLVSVIRIAEFFTSPHPVNDFFQSGYLDTLIMIVFQILLILLTFSLTFMVNQRLLGEIRLQEEKFSKAFHSSPYAITITRLSDGNIFEVNDGFKDMTGYSYDEIIGKTTVGLHLWANEEDRATAVRELSLGKQVRHMEFQFRRKSGEIMNGLFSADIVTINDEKWVLSSISDITELKRTQKELEEKAMELQRSNTDLERFAYMASHDLREPLRTISSHLQLLERKYNDQIDEKAAKYINFSVDAANRLQSMIGGLLEFSRIEREGGPYEQVDTGAVLEVAAGNLQTAIDESNALITHGPLPAVYADKGQLVLLFQNLLANAIKYHGKEPPQIHLSAEKQDGNWAFAVKDNGIGIDPEYKEQIFAVFQRLQGRDMPGIGLGLSVAKRIVERHGGRIWVESRPGEGATFYFTIPIQGGKNK
jgi:PAS domain S-box-containing protein